MSDVSLVDWIQKLFGVTEEGVIGSGTIYTHLVYVWCRSRTPVVLLHVEEFNGLLGWSHKNTR